MFAEMLSGIRLGQLPDPTLLRGRCHAAITKKLAFVCLPPVYWETDPKRNPDTAHLFIAVLLLNEPDMLEILKGIILMEQAERGGISLDEFMRQSLTDLLEMAPDPQFKLLLREIVGAVGSRDDSVRTLLSSL